MTRKGITSGNCEAHLQHYNAALALLLRRFASHWDRLVVPVITAVMGKLIMAPIFGLDKLKLLVITPFWRRQMTVRISCLL